MCLVLILLTGLSPKQDYANKGENLGWFQRLLDDAKFFREHLEKVKNYINNSFVELGKKRFAINLNLFSTNYNELRSILDDKKR